MLKSAFFAFRALSAFLIEFAWWDLFGVVNVQKFAGGITLFALLIKPMNANCLFHLACINLLLNGFLICIELIDTLYWYALSVMHVLHLLLLGI